MNKILKTTISKIKTKLDKSNKLFTRFFQSDFETKEWHILNMRQAKKHFAGLGYGIDSFIDFFDVSKPEGNL